MSRLKSILKTLVDTCGLVALKGGTEVEDMSFLEISFLRELGEPDLPLIVKIGGPEARNDIRVLQALGINGLLAPMVESEYGLRNFVDTVDEMYREREKPYMAVNIETITAYQNLETLLQSPAFQHINQVTVGRSDLSRSMRRDVDDEEVFSKTADIVDRVRARGKITSVGGRITPRNAWMIAERIATSRINTRHLIFDPAAAEDIAASIEAGLEFEIKLYERLTRIEPSKGKAYLSRIDTTRERMAEARVSLKRMVG